MQYCGTSTLDIISWHDKCNGSSFLFDESTTCESKHEDETTRIGLSEDEKGHIGEPQETLGAFFTLKFLLTDVCAAVLGPSSLHN